MFLDPKNKLIVTRQFVNSTTYITTFREYRRNTSLLLAMNKVLSWDNVKIQLTTTLISL